MKSWQNRPKFILLVSQQYIFILSLCSQTITKKCLEIEFNDVYKIILKMEVLSICNININYSHSFCSIILKYLESLNYDQGKLVSIILILQVIGSFEEFDQSEFFHQESKKSQRMSNDRGCPSISAFPLLSLRGVPLQNTQS